MNARALPSALTRAVSPVLCQHGIHARRTRRGHRSPLAVGQLPVPALPRAQQARRLGGSGGRGQKVGAGIHALKLHLAGKEASR